MIELGGLQSRREAIQESSIRRLSRLDRKHLPTLHRLARTHSSAKVRRGLLKALGMIGAPGSRQAVYAGLIDPNMSVRLAALRALPRYWTPVAAAAVRALAMRDESGGIRSNALALLIELDERRIEPLLRKKLRDKKWYIRAMARRALARPDDRCVKSWRLLTLFESPQPADRLILREVAASWPGSTVAKVRRSWKRELERFRARLGGGYEIRPSDDGWPAVYRGNEPVLWPGRVYALKSMSIGRRVIFRVAPVNFAWITARVPSARAFGIVTFAITSDGRVMLTRRGERANIYAGQLHGNGGNPDRIEPIEAHQIRETAEEIRARRSEIVPGSMVFGGLTENRTPALRGKPLLCGWLRLRVSSRELFRRVRRVPPDRRPGDAVGVESVALSPEGFDAILRRRRVPLCPSGAAGLVVMGYHLFGRAWARGHVPKGRGRPPSPAPGAGAVPAPPSSAASGGPSS